MINLGDKQIKDIYLGSKKIKEAYLGSKLVYKSNYFYIQRNLNLNFNVTDGDINYEENLLQCFLIANSKSNTSKSQTYITQNTEQNVDVEFPIDNITNLELHISPYSMPSITTQEYKLMLGILCTIDYNYTLGTIVDDRDDNYYYYVNKYIIGEKSNILSLQCGVVIPAGTNTVDGLNIPSLTFSEVDSDNKVVNKIFSVIFDQKLG